MGDSASGERRRISLELPIELVSQIDALRGEWGLRSRGDILVRLLQGIFEGDAPADAKGEDHHAPPARAVAAAELVSPQGLLSGLETSQASAASAPTEETAAEEAAAEEEELSTALDDRGALVLVPRQGSLRTLGVHGSGERPHPRGESFFEPGAPSSSGSGIDLPGFVRKRSDQLRRSLRVRPGSLQPDESLPRIGADLIEGALQVATQHWLDLYGSTPSDAVLEAAMLWLAQDIWPQSDQSEGRLFTWSLASEVVRGFVPSWGEAPASFDRVMVMAGLLEDPFSASTLDLRIPTLIRRFVHRFRRRRPGSSFLTLEHTMTVPGALKLLQLPTAPGHRFTLAQIREAYREMALKHHPDSGGSVDSMRRLNEAYHLLKELYR
ncbi:MAG: J domain-containing protein [Prochlorococcaceae cyanobacterium]